MKTIELFAGAGGLALGFARAGFSHELVVERDPHACATLLRNQKNRHSLVRDWNIQEMDVRDVDYREWRDAIDLVVGGPPCQPFSLGGKHGGELDERNMFPEAVRAVRETRPKAFVFENVKGLLRHSFADYFGYICSQLEMPEAAQEEGEDWREHSRRLRRMREIEGGLRYHVGHALMNAADHGVPQVRHRVLMVGVRADLHRHWVPPLATHSRRALLAQQDALANEDVISSEKPWVTVREALAGLPAPQCGTGVGISNHKFNPGARSYPGHTGSRWDWPAKTLKAGVHGVPGGENTLQMDDGSVRYFTIRESARIQTFDDDYEFVGSWTESMRQLGNAVPVELAYTVARSVRELIALRDQKEALGNALQPAGVRESGGEYRIGVAATGLGTPAP